MLQIFLALAMKVVTSHEMTWMREELNFEINEHHYKYVRAHFLIRYSQMGEYCRKVGGRFASFATKEDMLEAFRILKEHGKGREIVISPHVLDYNPYPGRH